MRFLRLGLAIDLFLIGILLPSTLSAQTTAATMGGQVTDQQGRVVAGASVVLTNISTGLLYNAETNEQGIYALASLGPGIYRANVRKEGFKGIVKSDIELHVQDQVSLNFTLQVGSVTEVVTVEGGAPLIDTVDASVSTVVDRNFAENLPMNGRSFQTLIQLTPGVVLTGYDNHDNGQFSVNGQRASSNYWMVDGVGANIGIGASEYSGGNGVSGSVGSFSALGGTNSLVSIDAMQEFRIQTSVFAPEFGRTPGGQISIVSRSGTNQFHGTLFEYFRNDLLDANDWFATRNGLPKPQERQNDFGGTLNGPIIRDRTFFFFSYEGLRLRLPEVAQSLVPDVGARQSAIPAMQPYINAYPLPTPGAPDDTSRGIAQFNASFSNRASLDAYSLRVDHKLTEKVALFARYNYSPSSLIQRGEDGGLSTVSPTNVNTQTSTAGAIWTISPITVNDARFNYSRTNSSTFAYLDSLGGAVPLTAAPFPSPFTTEDGALVIPVLGLRPDALVLGPRGNNIQKQINLVDSLTTQRGAHSLKFGIDYRRLAPFLGNPDYEQEALFLNVSSFASGNVLASFITSGRSGTIVFNNFGAFAQDTWRVNPRLTVTYGVRWDVDFAPYTKLGYLAVSGFNLNDLSRLALAPEGTPPFQTRFNNFGPRVGVAYQLSQNQSWQTVARGGFGVFYDLATSEVGNNAYFGVYPFGALSDTFGGSFPLSPQASAPPPVSRDNVSTAGVYAFDPNLKLPYTLQWNFALEQALGAQQTISASYVGAAGRRLLQTANVNNPNATFAAAQLIANAATSDYDALQLQFQRRLSRGLQALASYTWSHSIDTASAGSLYGDTANGLLPSINNNNHASSDFDIRHALTVGTTYDVPSRSGNKLTSALLGGWSVENVFQARSASPVTIFDQEFFYIRNDYAEIRPDIVPGQPFYLYGSQYPGGKAFNPAAFAPVPSDRNGNASRQGDMGRNALRAFGVWQWDLGVHRSFQLHESMKLEFRAEMFNVVNHPNFGAPISDISDTGQFGLSTQMFGRALAGSNVGGGAFNPLYQTGGPRSIQLALKLRF
jgi:hypothetical protein